MSHSIKSTAHEEKNEITQTGYVLRAVIFKAIRGIIEKFDHRVFFSRRTILVVERKTAKDFSFHLIFTAFGNLCYFIFVPTKITFRHSACGLAF